MRSSLLAAITANLSSSTAVRAVTELPWGQNNQPLYLKNLKKVYVDQEYREETTLYAVFNGPDVFDDTVICNVYFAVDAKNPPSGLDAAISQILAAKTATGVATNAGCEADYTVETSEDVLIYTFQFRVSTITY